MIVKKINAPMTQVFVLSMELHQHCSSLFYRTTLTRSVNSKGTNDEIQPTTNCTFNRRKNSEFRI